MYNACCKKCGSVDLFTKTNGSAIGLYCSDCGAWIKWVGKNELRAFENSKNESLTETAILPEKDINVTETYKCYELNLNKVMTIDDCKKLLQFLCRHTFKPTRGDVEYGGFSEVEEYFEADKI